MNIFINILDHKRKRLWDEDGLIVDRDVKKDENIGGRMRLVVHNVNISVEKYEMFREHNGYI